MGLTPDNRFGSQNSCRTADGAAGRGHEGCLAIHLQQFSQEQSQPQRSGNDDGIGGDGGQSYGGHFLKSQFETVQHHTRAENGFGAELDARHPCLGQPVAQGVGIEHSQDDTDDERTEGQIAYKVELGNVEGREGEQDDEKDAVHHLSFVFFEHILLRVDDSGSEVTNFRTKIRKDSEDSQKEVRRTKFYFIGVW